MVYGNIICCPPKDIFSIRCKTVIKIDVEIYNCPGFQAGVALSGMFWALAIRKTLLLAKAESLELL
jgi:hypothetical protein